MASWLSLILLLLLPLSPIVGIRVNPRLVSANGTVRVTCVVPRRAANRKLVMELEEYRRSEWDLEGEASPQIFETTIEHVPCVTHTAACSVMDELGKGATASVELVRGGCDQP